MSYSPLVYASKPTTPSLGLGDVVKPGWSGLRTLENKSGCA